MLLQRLRFPGSPLGRHFCKYRVGVRLGCYRTEHTCTGASHPGITVSTEPFYRFCYWRE
jgi:hypothetical protein